MSPHCLPLALPVKPEYSGGWLMRSSVLGGRADIDFAKMRTSMDPRWCPRNMFAWSTREVAWSTREILCLPVKCWVYPWKTRFIRRPAWAGTKQTLWLFFDPKALTDPAKYFGPKQPIPEPRTHSFLQKSKTVVKLSTSWVNSVFNANAKFNFAFV